MTQLHEPRTTVAASSPRATPWVSGLWTIAAICVLFVLGACGDSGTDRAEGAATGDETGESAEGEPSDGDDTTEQATSAETVDQTAGDLPEGAVANIADLVMSESSGCSFDEIIPLPVRPTCHTVTVPENWDDPDPGDQVVLQVAVFEGDGTHNDPYVYLDGGPGGETLDSMSFTFPALVEPLLGGRDFILFDQRGVGRSVPSLDCPEVTEVSLPDTIGDDPVEAVFDAQEQCLDRLKSSGVDLTRYNSIASANDVEAIRIALGHEQLNPVGVSYGTRLGQTYMRLYPASIRSMVLDSVFPTSSNLWTELGPGAERSFEQLFDGCASSPGCAGTYPDFEEEFFSMLDQLDAEPHQASVTNFVTGESIQTPIDGGFAMTLVFQALYSRNTFSVIPAMTEEVLNGDYTTLEFLGSVVFTNVEFVSIGLQLSVECNEELPFELAAEREANLSGDPRYERLEVIRPNFFERCEVWPSGAAPDVENETVASDVPTLLLAGQYDPITPPAGMDTIAAGLSDSYQFTLPHEGHGIVVTPCGAEIVAAFVDDPTTEPDTSCVAESPSPVFVLGSEDGEVIALVELESEGPIAITGVRPEGWTEPSPGVFARGRTALDPTVALVQPSQGQPAETVAAVAGSQLGIELTPEGTVEVDGAGWLRYTATDDQIRAEMLVREGENGIVALLVATDEEFDLLRDQVLLPMAAAAEPRP